ncbi:MAG: hypothetical protein H6Q89_2007 [Myxococcaceae bacterium]|nr:hypothetical protein [Myxococcaceae bacterium]
MQLSLGVLGLLAAAPAPSLDGFLRDVPGMTSQPTAPAVTTVDGIKVVQRSVSSNRSAHELQKHFAAAFDAAGLYIAPEQDEVKPLVGLQISGLDTENLLSYSALLQPAAKGTTVVIAYADLGKKKPTREPIGPVFPGANSITSFAVENQKATSYAVDATPAEIKAFYRETFAGVGFTEAAPNVFQKGNQQFTVTVSPGVSERYVLLKLETVPGAPAPAKPPPPAPKK